MLKAGLPAEQAILYFTDSKDNDEIAHMLGVWLRCAAVGKAQKRLLGKRWEEMSLDEQCDTALTQGYANLAYFLWAVNYYSADKMQKDKLDTARTALEARKAGTAGKGDALTTFFDDVKAGRIKLIAPGARPN